MSATPRLQRIHITSQANAALLSAGIEHVRTALGASGAVIVRVQSVMRELARAGNLHEQNVALLLNSRFTSYCIETGRILICQAQEDSYVEQTVARVLGMRSGIAAPVSHRGVLFGVIELISPQPSKFHGAHLETLKEVAELFAPVLWAEAEQIAKHMESSVALAA